MNTWRSCSLASQTAPYWRTSSMLTRGTRPMKLVSHNLPSEMEKTLIAWSCVSTVVFWGFGELTARIQDVKSLKHVLNRSDGENNLVMRPSIILRAQCTCRSASGDSDRIEGLGWGMTRLFAGAKAARVVLIIVRFLLGGAYTGSKPNQVLKMEPSTNPTPSEQIVKCVLNEVWSGVWTHIQFRLSHTLLAGSVPEREHCFSLLL